MSHKLFELEVRLQGIEPSIWRTIEVPGAWSLEDLHFAIQVAMGWTNSHLHQFKIGNKHFGMVDVHGADELELEDEREYRLQDLVQNGGSFVYEYDFGDSWEHHVTVKKVTVVTKPPRPRCIAGARACPPEDCGGTGGYENLLEALANPEHEEHEASMTWSGGFEPERFTLPKNGLDLRDEMKRLQELADDDDSFEEYDVDADDGPLMDLPKPLVEAVLALDPMQRASLGALIAGSLASEVQEAQAVIEKLALAMRAQKPARQGHGGRGKRARS